MAERRERIVLELDDQASAGLLRAAAAAKLARDQIEGQGHSSRETSRDNDRLGTSAGKAARETEKMGTSTRKAGRDLETYERNARRAERGSSALVDSVVALAPTLAPIGAAAVPALVGLTAQFGVAVAGAGTLVLAFQGVGDAMKVIGEYNAAPTAENLAKVNEALAALPPRAQEFVRSLDELRPVLKQLRDDSSLVFPGMSAGIDSLLTRLPQVRSFMQTIAATTGNLLEGSGDALAGPQFDNFFDYLNATAQPTLTAFGHAVGNLAQTFANLMVATAPLQSDFNSWLEGATRSLAKWSAGLDGSEGMQDFIDYVRKSGPEVGHAIASISNALLQVVEAAAPLGGPTLRALTAFANVVARVADSPLGAPLFAMASGLALVNRALAVSALAKDSLVADLIRGKALTGGGRGPTVFAQTATGAQRLSGRFQQLGGDIRTMRGEYSRLGATQAVALSGFSNTTKAAQRTRATLGTVGKGAAGIAALTVATSGLGEKMGVANTASLGLAGAMLGPVGAGVGAATGAFLDLKAVGNDVTAVFDNINRAARGSDFATLAAGLDRVDKAQGKIKKNSIARTLLSLSPGQALVADPDTSGVDKAQAKYDNLKKAYLDLARTVGTPLPRNASNEQIADFAERARPALAAAGISMSKLASGSKTELAAARDALSAFGIEMTGVSKRAQQMSIALDNALNPKVGLSAARDQLTQTIQKLKEMKGAAGLQGNSAGALGNRALVRDAVTQTQGLIKAQMDAGKGADVMTRTLQRSRSQIIEQGVAAGISRGQMRQYVNQLGLTPKLVQTMIRANVKEAMGNVRSFLQQLRLTPRQQSTLMKLASSGATGDLKKYIGRLNLTPAQKATLLKALTSAAQGNVAALQRQINGLRDREVKITVTRFNDTVNRIFNAAPGGPKARGGIMQNGVDVYARGGIRQYATGGDDRANAHQPKVYAPSPVYRVFAEPETMGEAYIPLAPDGRRPRAKAITEQVAARFGGTVAWNALGSITPGKDEADYRLSVLQQQQEIAQIRAELNATKIVGQKKVKRGKKTVLVGGHRVKALSGLARQIKNAEYRSALLNLQELKAQYAYDAATPARQAAIDAEKNRAQAQADAAKALASSTGDLSGKSGIFARGNSAQGALSSITRQIADVSTYGQIVAQLRSAGASPGLLAQVVQVGESGDLTSAIRMGRALLAQPEAIKGLNSSLEELNRVSTSVATYTNSAAFTSGAGALAAPATARDLNVNLLQDPSTLATEVARLVKHEVGTALAAEAQ